MTAAETRLMTYPFALLSELRDAANEHGYRIGPEEAAGWIFFRSASAPAEIGLAAASYSGPFFLSVMHQGVARILDYPRASPCAKGHAAAFVFVTRDDLHAGVQAVYRLSVSLPNFPLEKYEKAVEAMGDTEGERAQKFRIGQDVFREALMEYWNGSCPLSGISNPDLLRASHMMPWARCETDGQRLDVHNGLLLSALWDAAFDAGLVTFDDDGMALTSALLEGAAREALILDRAPRLALRDEHRPYLAYHRNHVWIHG
ncbi:MAG: HNH endonuclease [Mesorhizobium sp.]|nr:MAG: HNH endonuclease [Mesorhizobium sp.]TIM79177.1 MAG: HNH endonuclease [Mesorhizobium sp.]